MKDILIVRFGIQYDEMNEEEKEYTEEIFLNKFQNDFFVILFWRENKTEKTEFEIIKTK
jgi:hypothetical protein